MPRTIVLVLCAAVPLFGIGLARRYGPHAAPSASVTAAAPHAGEGSAAPVPPAEDVATVLPALRSLRVGIDETAPLRAKMRQTVDLELHDVPLDAALEQLSRASGVPIVLDEWALEKVPLQTIVRISFLGKDRRFADALQTALEPYELTWAVDDDFVRVPGTWQAHDGRYDQAAYFTCLYDLLPLWEALGPEPQRPKVREDQPYWGNFMSGTLPTFPPESPTPRGAYTLSEFADDVTDTLMNATSGPWLEDDGTGGTVSVCGEFLVIRHSQRVHDEIDALLSTLLHSLEGRLDHGSLDVWTRAPHELTTEAGIRSRLQERISVDFRKTPLREAVASIGERLGIRVRFDWPALAEEGVPLDEPVTLRVDDVPARSVLAMLLEPLKLRTVVRDVSVVVTSEVEANDPETVRVYDLRDLVARSDALKMRDLIINETSGPWLEVDGTGGVADEFANGVFVIRQSQRVHDELRGIFAAMRKAYAAESSSPAPIRHGAPDRPRRDAKPGS